MNIFEVLFLDRRDRDGDRDAIFLVRANDLREAVDLAMSMRGGNESFRAHTVFELGTELATRQDVYPRVLRGPYYECGFNYGWKEWRRQGEPYDTDNKMEVWEEEILVPNKPGAGRTGAPPGG